MEKNIYTEDEKKAITKLINQLKKGKISFREVPEEYQNHPLMVKKERKFGMRRSNRRGYDVLRNLFFVEEIFTKPSTPEMTQTGEITFPTFGEYYDFLNGDIYENACYYQYVFSKEEKDTYRIDLKRINYTALIKETIRDFPIDLSEEEAKKYGDLNSLNCNVIKLYHRKRKMFYVYKVWLDNNGQTIKSGAFAYQYFFDFVFFLENDLSGADLLFCDGLENLRDFSELNLTNAKLRSIVWDRIGVKYPLMLNSKMIEDFFPVLKNETETNDWLMFSGNSYMIESKSPQKVYYISDLHLLHQCQYFGCKSSEDFEYTLQRLIDCLLENFWGSNAVILIGGDTSSDFELFRLFISLLKKSLGGVREKTKVIFLLGNHELWGFPDCSFEETVKKYEKVIHEQGMYLLQNELLYRGDDLVLRKITAEELMTLTKAEIRERTKTARLLIFGGLAFSGYNEEFNANDGIYRAALNRDQEICKSKEFEKLYHIVCEALYYRSVIVFTHTPLKDWCSDRNCQPGFVYVSGHSHRNYFYDDGDYRVYADNQIGYRKQTPALKYFYIDGEYDVLADYEDGIHEITKDQYIDFYRGKNLQMQLNRDIHVLYMLKKNGYYCFIHSSKGGSLTILNGASRKKLLIKDINYYYAGMESEIEYIKNPLDKYTKIQKQIANEVKRIGGDGTIHGAIVDIDFYNHIFVMPDSLRMIAYRAENIIDKVEYPSILELLEANCPRLYNNYEKLLKTETKYPLEVIKKKRGRRRAPRPYYDTDIYQVSRELKKMQKLYSNILTTWHYRQDPESLGYKFLP